VRSFAHIQDVDVSMDEEDGTYRLRVFESVSGERIPTPRHVIVRAQSIPEGLRALAEQIEQKAIAEFSR